MIFNIMDVSIPIWYGLNKETEAHEQDLEKVSIPIWYGLNQIKEWEPTGKIKFQFQYGTA